MSRNCSTRFGALDVSHQLVRADLRVQGDALVFGSMLLRSGVEASRLVLQFQA